MQMNNKIRIALNVEHVCDKCVVRSMKTLQGFYKLFIKAMWKLNIINTVTIQIFSL